MFVTTSSNYHQNNTHFVEDDLKVLKPLIDDDNESECETAALSWSSLEVSSTETISTPSKSPSKKKPKHKSKGSKDHVKPDVIVSFPPSESSAYSKKSSKSKKIKKEKSRERDEKVKQLSKSSEKSSPKSSRKANEESSPNDPLCTLKVPRQRTRSSKTESKRRTKSLGCINSKAALNKSVPKNKPSKQTRETNEESSNTNNKRQLLKPPKQRTRSKSDKTKMKRMTKSLSDVKSIELLGKSVNKKNKSTSKKRKSKEKQEAPKPKFDAANISKLVKCEIASDRSYRTRRSSLTNSCIMRDMVFDWGMPLKHKPPSKREIGALVLRSCLQKKDVSTSRSVHWPSNIVDRWQVTNVVGYDESMARDCFYNSSDIEGFRLEVFIEKHQDEFEVVTDDEEYEYLDVIEEESIIDEYYEEEIVEEWYEEEVIEDEPEPLSVCRRLSF